MPQTRKTVSRDGVEIGYLEWGGPSAAPLIVLAHATGFCKEVCIPIVDELTGITPEFRALALDMRAHGDSGVPPKPFSWWDVAGDIIELVGAERGRVIGVGHSSGAAALIMAEILQPNRFAHLVLVEPIVFPPSSWSSQATEAISRAARRRRDRFPSRRAAFDSWVAKKAFAGWDRRAMQAYVDGGLREDNGEFVLKCSPDSEAEFFAAATEHHAWDRLGEVAAPTLLLSGEHSTTHREPLLTATAGHLPNVRSEIVAGAGHMVWMERPRLVAERIAETLH